MKFTERVAIVLFVIGFILKSSQVQGGDIILVTSLASLCLLYFPLGFYSLKKPNLSVKFIFPSIIYGFILSTMLVGLFFKLMILPGGEAWQVICSPFWFLAIATIIYKYLKATDAKLYYRSILIKSIFLLVLNIIFYIVPAESMIDLFNGKGTPASEQMKDYYHRLKDKEGVY
ncbi:MAG: hypothetical protein SGJ10_06155 [Bacteroidota bacterium]|nr:hypothetical protein [Bacteroidota bacterium]